MPYIKSTIVAGNTIEIKKYYSNRYKAKGIKRADRRNLTTEEQKEINIRHAEDKLRWRMNANFKDGDYHLVLDYTLENRPEGKEQMRIDIDDFLKHLRKEYKKLGMELKYIHVMEIGQKGARHHHLVINEIPIKILRKCWTKGRIHVTPLDTNGQYKKLASYFIKYSSRSKDLQIKMWNASRNLIIPEPKKEIILANRYCEDPKPIKGYYVDKETVVNFINEYDGFPILKYTLIKIDDREEVVKNE